MSWPTVRLAEVAEIERDAVAPEAIAAGTRYLGLEHIEAGGRIIKTCEVDAGELASTKFRFGPKHILYGKLRPYLAKIATPDVAGVCSTDILPIMPGPRLDRGYLTHFLREPSMIAYAASRSEGANLPRLSPKALAAFEIPLPPLEEQRRIAGVLDAADALRAKRRAALAKLDTLAQSIFIEMFGDPVANPKRWERVRLSAILDKIDSGWSPVCLDSSAAPGEWGVLKLGAVTRCRYDASENKALPEAVAPEESIEVKAGDLLFTRKNTRDLVGACAYVDETRPRLMLSDLIFRFVIKPDAPVSKVYLWQLLCYPSKRRLIQRLAGGAAGSMPNISKGRLLEEMIELPPLEQQVTFDGRLRRLWAGRDQMLLAERKSDSLFASLQHRAFTGQLAARIGATASS